jgi:hypothetical protein
VEDPLPQVIKQNDGEYIIEQSYPPYMLTPVEDLKGKVSMKNIAEALA